MEKHRQLQHSGQKKYRRLEILYRISQAIAKFETVGETVPRLMALAADSFESDSRLV